MNYIIVDLEATCWPNEKQKEKMEIIEIGAVKLVENLEMLNEFGSFVRPICSPILSSFCTKLTTITQSQVDGADTFAEVFPNFLQWIGPEPYWLCSWGHYDFNQFKIDCERHRISFPFNIQRHINLKQRFAEFRNIKPCGMGKALDILGWPLQGTHHRGIDDARNIAKIAQLILKTNA